MVYSAVIPGPERSEGARNPYPPAVIMDSGPAAFAASRNEDRTNNANE
jgi:hypothetical protein